MEVFSAQGRDPVAKWKLLGPVKREYDRHVKGYVYSMEGSSSTTTRMQLPRNEKAQCKLLAPLLGELAVFRGDVECSPLQWVWCSRTVCSSCWFPLMPGSLLTSGELPPKVHQNMCCYHGNSPPPVLLMEVAANVVFSSPARSENPPSPPSMPESHSPPCSLDRYTVHGHMVVDWKIIT